MKLRINILINVMLLCVFLNVEAKELSLKEVIERVKSTSQANMMRKVSSPAELKVSHAQHIKDSDKVAFYILDKGDAQGFIIAPADDVFPVVLGYTVSGDFNIDSIPPALRWYLERFEKTVEEMNCVYSIISTTEVIEDFAPIEPLLTTKWGQDYPYNLYCPSYNGYQFPTGCVPTAAAQIMNYHKWPEIGEGKGSTTFDNKELNLDFESISFDWTNMEDQYGADSSDQSERAVAELMYGCGVGVKACYGYLGYMTGGTVIGTKYFLTENMKYDSSMNLCYRYNYSSDEWNELIYNDLNNGLPVFCTGGQHAFVCDGYSDNGYFHINWGWQGHYDGYFLLSDLNPTEYNDNYHEDMMILTNIHPRSGSKQPLTVDLISQGEFKLDNYGNFAFDNIFNYSLKDFKGYFGVKAVSENNDCFYLEYGSLRELPATQIGGWSIAISHTGRYDYYRIPLDGKLPAGGYKLYQVYREVDGDYCDIRGLYGSPNFIEMNVDENGICTFLPLEFNYDIEVTEASVNDDYGFMPGLAYAGHELYNIALTLVNNMDVPYNSGIRYRITKEDALIVEGNFNWLLKPHSESRFGLGNTVGDHVYEKGEYKIEFFDHGGKKIDRSDFFFSVVEEPVPNLDIKDFYWEKDENQDRLTLSFAIENLSEYHYQGEFELVIDPPVFENRHMWINGVEGGGTVLLDWDFSDAESTFTEDTYQVYLYDHHGNQINKRPLLLRLNAIYVTEIELSHAKWTGKEDDSFVIQAIVLPEDATDKTLEWTSSDESVATVDSEGMVKLLKEGSCVITAKATDGSGTQATCIIDIICSVDELFVDQTVKISVFDTRGLLIKEGYGKKILDNLSQGIYILRQGKTIKRIII